MREKLPKRQKPLPGRWNQPGVQLIHIGHKLPRKGEICCSYVTTEAAAKNPAAYYFGTEGSGIEALLLTPKKRGFAPVAAFTDDCYSAQLGDGRRYVNKAEGVPARRRKVVGTARTLRELLSRTGEGKEKLLAWYYGADNPHYNEVWVEASQVTARRVSLSLGENGETIISPPPPPFYGDGSIYAEDPIPF